MTDRMAVSVVVVSRGRPASLAVTLKGLEYQRHDRFELIVVSDLAPADRPPTRLAPRWIRFDEANLSRARNLGIAAARGEIVAFCDDDAVPEYGWLDALSAPFADPAIGAAGGFVRGRNGVSFQWRCSVFDRCGRDFAQAVDPAAPTVFAPDAARFLKTVGTNCAFRRTALTGIGGFDEAFRFFLDEADVNLRLSQAGWSAAIVPLAEVHHGFAAGPLRTRRRVPTSLFEIGASLAHFLNRHAAPADIAPRLDEFRAEQRRRLRQHHLIGQLDGPAMRRLLQGLEDGFADGACRTAGPARFADCAEGGFVPAPRIASGRRVCLVGGPVRRGAAVARAREAAARGDEVTLILVEPTPRPLAVRFGGDGVFRHRIGLLGKSERTRRRRIATPAARVRAERARIAAQRG
ncbi:glycosyltransferase [Rhodobacteraceae bacterium 2CG4]|uniref:Glycosyltransferase n=1 Tax=Halovulum marinum TaxID=2662447 RepID=A0A6L5Z668_9RHOB|nr:glycosyltransferase [Halovulum marinum]MSU91545.1 glycosyltransferase [Halovulum marinum]